MQKPSGGRATSVGSADTPSTKSAKTYQEPYAICSGIESPSAGTLFHRVKFGLRKAFFIYFEMSTTTKSLLASYMAVCYTVAENTARLFMHKVREAMPPSGNHPMDGDDFVVGGQENGKVGLDYLSAQKVSRLRCATDKGREGQTILCVKHQRLLYPFN